jgi:hypothetical protein
VNDFAILFHPQTDFAVSRGVFASFRITLRPGVEESRLWAQLDRVDASFVPQGSWEGDRLLTRLGLPGSPDAYYLALFWYFDYGAEVAERLRRVSRIESVARLEIEYITRVWRGLSCLGRRVGGAAQPGSQSPEPPQRSAILGSALAIPVGHGDSKLAPGIRSG